MIGSAHGAVKGWLYDTLKTAMGTSVAVRYDAPFTEADFASESDELVTVWFLGESEVDYDAPFLGGPVRWQETIRLRLEVRVADPMRDGAGEDPAARLRRPEKRLDEVIGQIVEVLSAQVENVPVTVGDDNEIDVFWCVLMGTARRSAGFYTPTNGWLAGCSLPIEVQARTAPAS